MEPPHENNGRVLSLCDVQGSLWSKMRANLLTLFLMLAGTATEHRAGGSASRILLTSPSALGSTHRMEINASLLPSEQILLQNITGTGLTD